MTTAVQVNFPLNGALRCGECGCAMTVQPEREARYACASGQGCETPAYRAAELNRVILTAFLSSRFTPETTPQLAREMIELLDRELPPGEPMPEDLGRVIRKAATDPEWIMAEEMAEEAQEELAHWIHSVELYPWTARVRYNRPLPPGTALAGSRSQDVDLPEPVLA